MKKILVVDDEWYILHLIESNLIRAGYEVETAENGKVALEKIGQEKPAIIITNIMMPEIDGYQLLAELKSKDDLKDIPCIVVSAKTQKDDIDKAMFLGATQYITKPFEPLDLIAAVNRLQEKNPLPNKPCV